MLRAAEVKLSIIICTCNRAASLKETLGALNQLPIPDGIQAELLVVDNGSTDDTRRVVAEARIKGLTVRYLHEGRTGKNHGLNAGLAVAAGEALLFTDDDVRPSVQWIDGMCQPLVQGAHAVAGGVRIAPHLLRPWMTRLHRSWLASTEYVDCKQPQTMVGANMAFNRKVLNKVPGFDVELGPGALGFGDDSLFALQLLQAGFRIEGKLDTYVEHWFDPQRLSRTALLHAAAKRGEVEAYMMYHWKHEDILLPGLRSAWASMKSRVGRTGSSPLRQWEGAEARELWVVFWRHQVRRYLWERKRERNYDRFGLVKRASGIESAKGGS